MDFKERCYWNQMAYGEVPCIRWDVMSKFVFLLAVLPLGTMWLMGVYWFIPKKKQYWRR